MSDIVAFPGPAKHRIQRMADAAEPLGIVFPESAELALTEMPTAKAFIGKLTPELLSAAEQLEWVQAPTASLEHFMFPALMEHTCSLTNVAGIFGDVIAEHVLGYLLSFTRNLHLYRDRQNDRRYEPVGAQTLIPDFVGGPQNVTPVDMAHRRLAELQCIVIGIGGIGRQVATTITSFGRTPDGVDPRHRIASESSIDRCFLPDQLPDQIGNYDVVIITAPHTPDTEGWFDGRMLSRMKPGAILINVGRGAIVCTNALIEALQSDHLGGAALDVLADEPLPSDSPLWEMRNVLLTPHVAACCDVIAQRQEDVIVENLRRFACGEALQNVVDKTMWC